MLEQKIGIEVQHKWLSKLMEYEFKIEYKKGKENLVANALSRKGEAKAEEVALLAHISFPTTDWVGELKLTYKNNKEASIMMEKLLNHQDVSKGTTLQQGIILRKGRIFIVLDSPFKLKVL